MLLERILRGRGHEVRSCGSAEEALEVLRGIFCPLITLDIGLPGMSGLEFARMLRAGPTGDAHYILVGTGNNRPEDLREILSAGADDYIAKPYHPGLLDVRLSVAEAALKGIARRKALEAELVFLARHDPLTKLMNRSCLAPAIDRAIERARLGDHGAVLYLDLDNFKIVNDSLGHDTGDDLLLKVADTLRTVSRKADALIRFGGDEFVLVMPGCDVQDAKRRAESIREAIEDLAYVARERTLRVGVSIGIAPVDGTSDASEVMARADEACYAAKARGRNCVEVHSAGASAIARLIADTDWTSRIRTAMVDGSLQLWFQPLLACDGRGPLAQEILLRYSEDGTTVRPAVFLESLRRAGQMARLDRFVIARAFEAVAANPSLAVSINISGQLFSDPDYCEFVEKTLDGAGIDPARILFEITEDELIANLPLASGAIRRLQQAGLRFCLDDFGAGFSSLTYLNSLPVDFIKIDGTFIRGIKSRPFQTAVVRGIQGIASTLGIRTVAESVENLDEFREIRQLGVDYVQGHLFARPRATPYSPEEIAAMLGICRDPEAPVP